MSDTITKFTASYKVDDDTLVYVTQSEATDLVALIEVEAWQTDVPRCNYSCQLLWRRVW